MRSKIFLARVGLVVQKSSKVKERRFMKNICSRFIVMEEIKKEHGFAGGSKCDAVKIQQLTFEENIRRKRDKSRAKSQQWFKNGLKILIASSCCPGLVEEALSLRGPLSSQEPGNASRKKDFRFPTKEQTGFQIEKAEQSCGPGARAQPRRPGWPRSVRN